MLTARQKTVRETGIGASEVSAILELNPYKAPIDIWLRKPTPRRPPLVVDTETNVTEVGSLLEGAILEVYRRRTGIRMRRQSITRRHRKWRHVLASPDSRTIDTDEGGAEIKLVGSRMAHHWEDDTIPDYVLTQAAQNIAVCDCAWWDVVALVGGTDLRIHRVERDRVLEEGIIEACETFWTDHIDGEEPPEVRDAEERRRYLRARYPGSEKSACAVDEDQDTRELVEAYLEAKHEAEEAKKAKDSFASLLEERIADGYGIQGDWGKFISPRAPGHVDWRAVALELGVPISIELIEKHRGDPYRIPRYYPPSKKKATAPKRGRAA